MIDFQPDPPNNEKIDFQIDFKPEGKTSLAEDFKLGVAGVKNTFTKAGKMGLGAVANALGDTGTADEIYRDMEDITKGRIKEANPQNREQGFGGKAFGMLTTLPGQLAAMPFSPFDTGQELIESGEDINTARGGVAIDTAMNMAGIGLPGYFGKGMVKAGASGAGINALQDTIARLGISELAATDEAKKKFEATPETAALAAIPGAGIGMAHAKAKEVKGRKADAVARAKLADLERLQPKPVKPGEGIDIDLGDGPNLPPVMRVEKSGQAYDPAIEPFREMYNKKPPIETIAQHELFDQPESGRTPSPNEAVLGDWRVDENGIPIKADLSMEAANLEAPLQKSLWGDELAPKHEQEARPITEAIDETRAQADAVGRDGRYNVTKQLKEQMDRMGLNKTLEADGELRGALLEANTPWSGMVNTPISSKGSRGRQRGAVNPEMFTDGIKAVKQIGEYTLQLLGRQNGPEVAILDKDGNEIGSLATSAKWKGDQQNVEADFVKVQHAHRGQGLAEAAYRFLAENGNDIRRSDNQLDDGKKLWNKFEEKGISRKGYIPRSQRGSLIFEPHPLGEKIAKIFGKEGRERMVSQDPPLEPNLAKARDESDGRGLTYAASGATLEAMKRGSTAIKMVAEYVQNAFKRADVRIEENVYPVENTIRKLSDSEIVTLGEVFRKEMFQGQKFDGENIMKVLSVNEQMAYKKLREMFEDTLKVQNDARAAKKQPPITPMEAYLSSRWRGDFRRPVYDADGKLVWYLAADTKVGLHLQTKELLKQFPDLVVDKKKDHVVRNWNRKTDLESAYTTMLDILGRDDPAVEKLKHFMEEQTVNRGASMLNQEKHFKDKANIRGFIGDRPGKDPKQEAIAMFEQQIQYAKNAYKWSEMQKASENLKKIVNDPALIENQPNNIKYIREYIKNAVGNGESRAVRVLEDTVRDLGISPKLFDEVVGGMKSFFILQKLAVNTGYAISNAIQYTTVLPHLMDLRHQGYKGDILTSMAAGLMGGAYMGAGHGARAAFGLNAPQIPHADFFNKAFKYAEDNGITARSLYDESPISSSFSAIGKLGHMAGKTMTVPETFLRAMAFTTYAQFLKSSKKFDSDEAIFREAEHRVNASMGDYASTERPMMFNKMGIAGNAAGTLQTFPFNFYNQYSYFTREAFKGNPMPLLTMIGLQGLLAGAAGVPGFEDAYKLLMAIKDTLPAKYWKKVHEHPFFSDPKLYMLENFGASSVYGVLSDATGIGLTSRIAAPSAGQMLASPAGPATDIAKQVGSVASLAMDPTNTTKQAQAAMRVTPPGLAGLVETSPMMEGKTYNKRPDGTNLYKRGSDIESHKGEYTRTPEEEGLRKWGLRSMRETIERDVAYSTNRNINAAQDKARTIPDKFYDAVKRKDMEEAKELFETNVYLTGKGISKEQFMSQVREEYMTTTERAKTSARMTARSIQEIARMEKIFDELEHANKPKGQDVPQK